MVGVVGSSALTPPGCPSLTFLSVGGGCSRIFSSGTSRDPPSTFFMLMVGAPGPSALAPHGSRMGTGGGHCRGYRQHPERGRHRHLQLWWWSLPDLPPAPPRGAVIDVSIFSGGHCRTYRQHPRGPPSTSPISGPPAPAPPRRSPSTFLSVDGGRSRTSSSGTPRGAAIDC
jgi:hypothetical protein